MTQRWVKGSGIGPYLYQDSADYAVETDGVTKAANHIIDELTAGKIVKVAADKSLDIISNLANFIAGTSPIQVGDDGDGTVTISLDGDYDTEAGELYITGNTTAISILIQNQWYTISNFSTGVEIGVTCFATGISITSDNFTYLISCSLTFRAETAGDIFEFCFDVISLETKSKQKVNADATDVTVHLQMLYTMGTSNEYVNVKVRNTSGVGDITIKEANFTVVKV